MINLTDYIKEALDIEEDLDLNEAIKVTKDTKLTTYEIKNASKKCAFTEEELQYCYEELKDFFDLYLTKTGNLRMEFNGKSNKVKTKTHFAISKTTASSIGNYLYGASSKPGQYYARVFRENSDRYQKLGLFDDFNSAVDKIHKYVVDYIKRYHLA